MMLCVCVCGRECDVVCVLHVIMLSGIQCLCLNPIFCLLIKLPAYVQIKIPLPYMDILTCLQ